MDDDDEVFLADVFGDIERLEDGGYRLNGPNARRVIEQLLGRYDITLDGTERFDDLIKVLRRCNALDFEQAVREWPQPGPGVSDQTRFLWRRMRHLAGQD